jgi:hypothetical protein
MTIKPLVFALCFSLGLQVVSPSLYAGSSRSSSDAKICLWALTLITAALLGASIAAELKKKEFEQTSTGTYEIRIRESIPVQRPRIPIIID